MPRFFVAPFSGDTVTVTGDDAHHLSRVLRVRMGEKVTVCDRAGNDYTCLVESVTEKEVRCRVTDKKPTLSEPTVSVTLYQGLPKSEKMEWIIQKCVEIGVNRIVPVAMARSVVRLKAEEAEKKQNRWQKIAAEAAMQSGRGIIPSVERPISFNEMLTEIKSTTALTFYEGGGVPLSSLVDQKTQEVALVVGPEGGFETEEIERLKQNGAHIVTLGKRILRCETAPLVSLAAVMQLTGNME